MLGLDREIFNRGASALSSSSIINPPMESRHWWWWWLMTSAETDKDDEPDEVMKLMNLRRQGGDGEVEGQHERTRGRERNI